MRYFECDFRYKNPESGEYSICIKGLRKPTKKEVEQFCAKDMEMMGLTRCVGVYECTHEDAINFYDMENEDKFPVFGG